MGYLSWENTTEENDPSFTRVILGLHMCVDKYVWVEVDSRCYPQLLLYLLFWDRVSHWTWRSMVCLEWLAANLLEVLLSPAPQFLDFSYTLPHPASFCGFWGLSLIPYVCMTNTLPTELSHQPLQLLFFFILSLASTTCYTPRNEGWGVPMFYQEWASDG